MPENSKADVAQAWYRSSTYLIACAALHDDDMEVLAIKLFF
jgi:hypothetical protein